MVRMLVAILIRRRVVFFKSYAVALWFMIKNDKAGLKTLDIEPVFSMSKINQLFERAEPEHLLFIHE